MAAEEKTIYIVDYDVPLLGRQPDGSFALQFFSELSRESFIVVTGSESREIA
jgi:hypothetical protein